MYMFRGGTNITSIVVPEGVTEIEEGTFKDCENLTNVYYFMPYFHAI